MDDSGSTFFHQVVHPPTTVLEHTMIKKTVFAAAVTGLLLAAGQASAATITFEDLAEGATLSTQYAGLGVTFSPNVFADPLPSPTGGWATNTDMTITSTDVGGLGSPSLVSGNLLHAFGNSVANGWLSEDGDPSFLMTFSTPISFISAAFAGVSTPADVHLIAYNGATQLGDITSAVTTGQFVLSFAAASITSVAITPGSFNDWVGVDNINFTAAAVPEASTYAMMALGMGLLAFKRRKAA
jgi:hypothetical protein